MSNYTLYGFLCAIAIVAIGYLLCSLLSWSLHYKKWNKFSITLKNALGWVGYVPIAVLTFNFIYAFLPFFLYTIIKSYFLDLSYSCDPSLYLFEFQAKIHQIEYSVFRCIIITAILLLTYGLSIWGAFKVGIILCPSKQIRIILLPIAITLTIFEVVNLVLLWHSLNFYGNLMNIIFVLLLIVFCAGFSIFNESFIRQMMMKAHLFALWF